MIGPNGQIGPIANQNAELARKAQALVAASKAPSLPPQNLTSSLTTASRTLTQPAPRVIPALFRGRAVPIISKIPPAFLAGAAVLVGVTAVSYAAYALVDYLIRVDENQENPTDPSLPRVPVPESILPPSGRITPTTRIPDINWTEILDRQPHANEFPPQRGTSFY